jgi:SAM-dependent methyltransferase
MTRSAWDERHAARRDEPTPPPDPRLLEGLEHVVADGGRGGRALELAAGTGRNALELARRGWRASAWDVSPVGLGVLAERAAAEGLEVETRAIDLEGEEAGELVPHWDLVVVVHYLDRPLLARLAELVRPGGHAVVTTFTVDHPAERPSRRFRLERGELGAGLAGFATRHASEEGGLALWVGRREGEAE